MPFYNCPVRYRLNFQIDRARLFSDTAANSSEQIIMFHTNDQIGPYTLIRPLGRGGYGVVWLAERRGAIATTRVAIKLPLAEDPDWSAIAQESQLWARLGSHPNLLSIIEADIYDGQVVIVSEFAPDGSLDNWLRIQGGVVSLPAALTMLGGILAGLAHLHARGVIHRDLKPANILLQGETPRLADFGLARRLKASAHSGKIAGTPAYMAPEVFDGQRSEQTDIWSVGVIFYEMLAGRLPYPQVEFSVLLGAILRYPPDPLPATLPLPIQQFIWQSLAKEPAQRFSSAREMRTALSQLIISNLSLITRDELLINGLLNQIMTEQQIGASVVGNLLHGNLPIGNLPTDKQRVGIQAAGNQNPLNQNALNQNAGIRGEGGHEGLKAKATSTNDSSERLDHLPGANKISGVSALSNQADSSLPSIDINLSAELSGSNSLLSPQSFAENSVQPGKYQSGNGLEINPAQISPLGLSQTLPTIPLSGVLPEHIARYSDLDGLQAVIPVADQPVVVNPINNQADQDMFKPVEEKPAVPTPEPFNYQFETRQLDNAGNLLIRNTSSASYFIEPLDDNLIEMVAIPAGEFLMGSRAEDNPPADELPQRTVRIAPFYLGKFPITQAQWRVVAGWPSIERELNPSPASFLGDQLPVEQISWLDASEFCARLSLRTGRIYRLPSEAEWEYACRAGSSSPFAFGETLTTTLANFNGNYPFAQAARGVNRAKTISVGSLGIANQFGLYDMHGNVWEWCADQYFGSYQAAPDDGSSRQSTDGTTVNNNRALMRVYRGGSWYDIAGFCRSAYRSRNLPIYRNLNLGFRIAVTIG